MIRRLLLPLIAFFFFSSAHAELSGLRYLPVQDGGRIKPFDTLARETLQLVYGKSTYEGREAYEIVISWMLKYREWKDKEIFEIRNKEILAKLNLKPEKRWYSEKEVFGHDEYFSLVSELASKLEQREKLTPYFQAIQRLESQRQVFGALVLGEHLKVMPSKNGEAWVSVSNLEEPYRAAFMQITKSVYRDENTLKESVRDFQKLIRKSDPTYSSDEKIKLEVHYNSFHPFRWAYVSYLIALLLMAAVWIFNKPTYFRTSWLFVGIGFLMHSYGFFLRIYLADRAPVSNMYETVVWVAWGAVLFSCFLEFLYRYKFILFSGAFIGLFSLILADLAPVILDSSLQPLEAVLRSNYWLIVHVMPISISYAAFFLAFVLGDIGLVYFLIDEKRYVVEIEKIVLSIYRSIQIGVSFLAPGIILGGLWADVSWGRFWEWDPKETWSLIVLLGYIALLHGRMTSWVKSFGMVVSAVAMFSLVIMAWYGVNYILGAGLHSYGFGAGGIEYVMVFICVHAILLTYVALLRRHRSQP